MRRSGLIGLLALVVGGSGCAGTARRDDGTLMFKPRAWSAAPAPEQVQLKPAEAAREESAAFTQAKPQAQGISRLFPGLHKGPTEPIHVASNYRPSWFGLRKPKAPSPAQSYATDARSGLAQRAAEPSLLPVALRVPTDPSVRPTAAEVADAPAPSVPAPVAAEAKKAYEEGVNPLPPAAEPEAVPVINHAPEVPEIDPRQDYPATSPEPAPAADRKTEEAAPVEARPSDSKEKEAAREAAPIDLASSRGLQAPTFPVSLVRRDTMSAPAHVHTDSSTKGRVLASPQIAPTSKVGPSPQSSVKATAEAKKWRRPCLRRFVRKTWKIGEYASPPTAAPH